MTAISLSDYDRAMRKNDIAALFMLLFGVVFLARGDTMVMTKPTGPAMYLLAACALLTLVLVPLLVRGVLKRVPRGEDEYLRKLLAQSGACGFYFAFTVAVVWMPLTGSALPDLAAPQMLGLMNMGAALGWLGLRWRDSRR